MSDLQYRAVGSSLYQVSWFGHSLGVVHPRPDSAVAYRGRIKTVFPAGCQRASNTLLEEAGQWLLQKKLKQRKEVNQPMAFKNTKKQTPAKSAAPAKSKSAQTKSKTKSRPKMPPADRD